jgi:hypothetical protein
VDEREPRPAQPVRDLRSGRAAAGEGVGGQRTFVEAAEAERRWPRRIGLRTARLGDQWPGFLLEPDQGDVVRLGAPVVIGMDDDLRDLHLGVFLHFSASRADLGPESLRCRLAGLAHGPGDRGRRRREPARLWKQWAAVRIHCGAIRVPVQK